MRLSFLLASTTVTAVLFAYCSYGCSSKQEKVYTIEDLRKVDRQVKLRFRVDPDFEGLVLVKEDPDLPLDFERTYDVTAVNGEVLMPSGFLFTGEEPVFHRVVEVVDARTGRVISSGEEANNPPDGVFGVRSLVGISDATGQVRMYFVISDGTPKTFEFVHSKQRQQSKDSDE